MFYTSFIIPVVTIVAVFTYAVVVAMGRARLRELEIRERIAMIEKGMLPPPEVDPGAFEHRLRRTERLREGLGFAASRHRRAGITLMSVGFGLMVLLSFAASATREGIGVGGFLVVLGAGFFLNSFFELRHDPPSPSNLSSTEPPPSGS